MTLSTALRARRLVVMVDGLIVWSSCFVLLYATLSVGCRFDIGGLRVLLAGVWLIHLAIIVWLGLRTRRAWNALTKDAPDSQRFLLATTGLVQIVAAIATILIGFPVLILPPCP